MGTERLGLDCDYLGMEQIIKFEKASTKTGKCPDCGTKYPLATGWCPKCKKKVKPKKEKTEESVRKPIAGMKGYTIEVEHVASYECERLPIYSNTPMRGQIKTIHIWENVNDDRPHMRWYISVGKGGLFHFMNGDRHAELNEFKFEGLSNKPQRWVKI